MRLSEGEKIGGRYKVIRSLGTGGMATVYLAYDLILNRQVAVKVLRYDFTNDQAAIRRFQREALSATQLTHPNIVGVYDVGEEDGNHYIVMEYVDGMDLKNYIRQRGPIPPKHAVEVMKQILSAIDMAHKNGIIHRDIKPQNILIDADGNVKITDFGIAIVLSETSLTQTNTVLGSVHYLSPEQARGGMATIQTDIYALGIVLFELLVGYVPFDGETAVSIALKHFQEPLPSIAAMLPNIPQSLENVILKATEKEVLYRYPSCSEMYEDLSSVFDAHRENERPYVHRHHMDETIAISPVKPVQQHTIAQEVPNIIVADTKEASPQKNGKKYGKMLIGAVMAIIVVLGAWFTLHAFNESNKVTIPTLIGKTQQEATKLIQDAGLKLGDVTEQASDSVEAGKVISSSPASSTIVKKGDTVQLVVSKGTDKVTIGDYTNQAYTDVYTALRSKGIMVERVEAYDSTVAAGAIIKQSIQPQTQVVAKETTIQFTVSKGKEMTTVPSLVNKTKEEAEQLLATAGLVAQSSEEFSISVSKGNVVSQSVSANTEVEKGSTVSFVVSKGSEQRTVTQTITIPYGTAATSSSSTTTQKNAEKVIQIYIEDDTFTFTMPYKTLRITEDTQETLTFTLKAGQLGRYKVVRDGSVIMESTVR